MKIAILHSHLSTFEAIVPCNWVIQLQFWQLLIGDFTVARRLGKYTVPDS